MGRVFKIKCKVLKRLEIPLLKVLNIYKLEREEAYEKHKLSKREKERKDIRA